MSQAASLAEDIEQLDGALKHLRVAYEKYFAGVERIEPIKERDEVKKELRRLLGVHNNNTARRFRLQTLQASLVTHESYWNRITRQIEEGTFKRDRLKAEKILRNAEQGQKAPEPSQQAPHAVAHTASVQRQYPEPLRRLHEAFVAARRQLGQPDAVPIESFAATVQKQYVSLKARYNTSNIEFKVAIKDGRAILKAVPKTQA